MNLISAVEMYFLEERMRNDYGVSSFILMENAASGAASEIALKERNILGRSVAIIAGKGSNGGDGLAIGRWLHTYGARLNILIIGKEEELKEETLRNYSMVEKLCEKVLFCDERLSNEALSLIEKSDIVVDAIFGTGLSRNLSEDLCRSIDEINKMKKKVYSIDMPTGIKSKSGQLMGNMIKSNCTITFEYAKPGLYLQDGKDSTDEVIVKKLGFPLDFIPTAETYDHESFVDAAKLFKTRKSCTHKGSYGKVMCICGSEHMMGAAVMTCLGAANLGVGLLYIASTRGVIEQVVQRVPEAIAVDIDSDALMDKLMEMDSLVIGPGLGKDNKILEALDKIIKEFKGSIVIDADALGAVELDNLPENVVITPHLKEASKIFNANLDDIKNDLLGFAERQKGLHTLVLKSNGTVVCRKDKPISINTSGNAGMAKGGSGDVLAGMLGAVLAQKKLESFEAVKFAVYLHGYAADLCERDLGIFGVKPSIYVEYIARALERTEK